MQTFISNSSYPNKNAGHTKCNAVCFILIALVVSEIRQELFLWVAFRGTFTPCAVLGVDFSYLNFLGIYRTDVSIMAKCTYVIIVRKFPLRVHFRIQVNVIDTVQQFHIFKSHAISNTSRPLSFLHGGSNFVAYQFYMKSLHGKIVTLAPTSIVALHRTSLSQ